MQWRVKKIKQKFKEARFVKKIKWPLPTLLYVRMTKDDLNRFYRPQKIIKYQIKNILISISIFVNQKTVKEKKHFTKLYRINVKTKLWAFNI